MSHAAALKKQDSVLKKIVPLEAGDAAAEVAETRINNEQNPFVKQALISALQNPEVDVPLFVDVRDDNTIRVTNIVGQGSITYGQLNDALEKLPAKAKAATTSAPGAGNQTALVAAGELATAIADAAYRAQGREKPKTTAVGG